MTGKTRIITVGVALLVLILLVAILLRQIQQPREQSQQTKKQVATTGVQQQPTTSSVHSIQHYEYVFPNGGMDVYDIDHNFSLVKHIILPDTAGQRGAAVSLPTHTVYVSYGNDGDSGGRLLAYDLVANKIVWTKQYNHGIDSLAITPDGKTIYMPAGEESGSNLWYIEDAATGNDVGTIQTDADPHDTVVSVNGSHVYMGPRQNNDTPTYLYAASTATNQITQKVGPFLKGVRPFTVNKEETIVYASTTGFLGFQVGSITTGKILYTVPIEGFSCPGNGASDPSHGISLSPDEKEIYIVDSPCGYIHVFDVSSVPNSGPVQVANIKLNHPMLGSESPCAYDCQRDGWVQHSTDGRYVFVGDSGDVISTATRTIVGNLPSLQNTRVMLEIDWQNNVPIATSQRQGLGYSVIK